VTTATKLLRDLRTLDTAWEDHIHQRRAPIFAELRSLDVLWSSRSVLPSPDADARFSPEEKQVRAMAKQVISVAKAVQNAAFHGKIIADSTNTLGNLATKRNPHPCRDAEGQFASCGVGSGARKPKKKPRKPKPKKPAPKKPGKPTAAEPASRTSRFHLPEHGPGVNRRLAIDQAARKAEASMARRLGGRHVGDFDKLRNKQHPSYDIHLPAKKSPSKRDEFVEMKYKSEGKKNQLSVHADALLRKAAHQAEAKGSGFHTVLIDVRDRSFGGSEARHYQGHDLYYRRGTGAYSTANMYRVKDMAELKQLIATPDNKLPMAARGTMPRQTRKLKEQAAKVEASRARRDADGKKQERRQRYNERKRAGLLGTATAKPKS
jgi:hypothetical protein